MPNNLPAENHRFDGLWEGISEKAIMQILDWHKNGSEIGHKTPNAI